MSKIKATLGALQHKQDYYIVELDPATMELQKVWPSITEAAKHYNVSRQAIHQAVHDGSIRAEHRWMFRHVYEVWKRTFEQDHRRGL